MSIFQEVILGASVAGCLACRRASLRQPTQTH